MHPDIKQKMEVDRIKCNITISRFILVAYFLHQSLENIFTRISPMSGCCCILVQFNMPVQMPFNNTLTSTVFITQFALFEVFPTFTNLVH